MAESTAYSSVPKDSRDRLPRISVDLWKHKTAIGITWAIIFVTGGILPVVLYFALRYGAHLKLSYVLAITTALFGVFNVFSLGKRTFALTKKNSTCRPLGGSRWGMDFFNINYIIGFIAITAVIIIGNITLNIRTVVLGLPILIAEVCAQLLFFAIMSGLKVRTPIRISSTPAGEPFPAGAYVLAEDICAVDGGQGQTFRQQLRDRYFASRTVRHLCWEMDLIWGVSGLVIGVGSCIVLFLVPSANVAYILGWTIPWAYAAIMATFTITYCHFRLKNETLDRAHAGKDAIPAKDSF